MMSRKMSIITVGLSPAWDITCRGRKLDWGQHETIDEQTIHPAGKALNVCMALAWMGQKSIAAGLWGEDDYEQMRKALQTFKEHIKIKMTPVAGDTRRNITIVNTASGKDMHLRCKSHLASAKSLKRLQRDLGALVHKNSICVFAGTMPGGELLCDIVRVMELCKSRGAKIVLDTSGPALREIVRTDLVWLIKPNVEELCELLNEKIEDEPEPLARAGRGLLDKVDIVLVSRGEKGSVVVTKEGAWKARALGRAKVLSTVGCGDYLLAGFLKDFGDDSNLGRALKTATKLATARAWGWTEQNKAAPRMLRQIEVVTKEVISMSNPSILPAPSDLPLGRS